MTKSWPDLNSTDWVIELLARPWLPDAVPPLQFQSRGAQINQVGLHSIGVFRPFWNNSMIPNKCTLRYLRIRCGVWNQGCHLQPPKLLGLVPIENGCALSMYLGLILWGPPSETLHTLYTRNLRTISDWFRTLTDLLFFFLFFYTEPWGSRPGGFLGCSYWVGGGTITCPRGDPGELPLPCLVEWENMGNICSRISRSF